MQLDMLKELIKVMELRAISFECNSDTYKELIGRDNHFSEYWEGKRSEADFVLEKLTYILENSGL